MRKTIYIIWIWWIWVSALARYYLHIWYKVYWSDKIISPIVEELKKEWVKISILKDIKENIDLLVYSEAVNKENEELKLANKMSIKALSYPKALWEIVNKKKLVAVTWTHWKSTTSSLTSLVLKKSFFDTNSIVWTILKEFGNKNAYFSKSDYFVIEACEYKRSFLNYKPFIWVITNIEIDHLDYYKDLSDYISAFKEFIENIVPWWVVILNWECENSKKLIWLRDDIYYVIVYRDYFIVKIWYKKRLSFPEIKMKVPWEHILFDAKLAFVVWKLIAVDENIIVKTLEAYSWVWRRMEIIWETQNKNILISDYWHHPTEIKLTLEAIKNKYLDKKLFVIFQPHQYNRTLELLDWFKNCFEDAKKLVIPDIYESRDTKEDKEKINSKKLVELINHEDKLDWEWLENTLDIILKYDKENPDSSIIVLMWAWDVDDLRYKIKTS